MRLVTCYLVLAFLSSAPFAFSQAEPVPAFSSARFAKGGFHVECDAPFISAGRLESQRLQPLLRGDKLYLSLEDAIALALENNLDIQLQRCGIAIANADVLRARGGGMPRGVDLRIGELPQGLGGPSAPIVNGIATGATPSTAVTSNLIESNAILPAQSSSAITGAGAPSAGPPVPAFDFALTSQVNLEHTSTPEANPFVFGASSLNVRSYFAGVGIQKGFDTGAQLSITYNNNALRSNSIRNSYNPYSTTSLGLTVMQPLMRGFGTTLNNRYIRIAQNNRSLADIVFQSQVIAIVNGVVRLYYDLVSLTEDTQVKRQTIQLAQKLYEDNKDKADHGTVAPIEVVRAQAQQAAARQDLANAEGFELQQELLLKTVITREGTQQADIRNARILPTTPIDLPVDEPVRPIQDLMADAFGNRPELSQALLQVESLEIGLLGARSSLRPELNVLGLVQNNGLAGQVNPNVSLPPGAGNKPDPALLGGYETGLAQLFRRNYPTYGIGLQLTLPLRDRIAEADYARDEHQFKQAAIREQQIKNQIQLEVEDAAIALRRTREAYEAAMEARKLQEQSVEIELEKYDNGVSTNLLVMQYQSMLAQARSTEVSARGSYAKARLALERATGMTLPNHRISVAGVFQGRVAPSGMEHPSNTPAGAALPAASPMNAHPGAH